METSQGMVIVGVGSAWEETSYEGRRADAIEDAREHLTEELARCLQNLGAGMMNNYESHFGYDRKRTSLFFRRSAIAVARAHARGTAPKQEWECLIRHQVFVRMIVPEHEILKAFREYIRRAVRQRQGELFRKHTGHMRHNHEAGDGRPPSRRAAEELLPA